MPQLVTPLRPASNQFLLRIVLSCPLLFQIVEAVNERLLPRKCLAGNVGVPIHEGAVGILLPGPHVKGVERGKPEAIGTFEIME
jgi:hypothetical protein